MSNKIQVTKEYLNQLAPLDIPADKAVGEHFVSKFMAMYQMPKEQAVAFYEREKDNYTMRIQENPDLRECTPLSIFMGFMKVGGWKLSFEAGSQPDIYLIPGNKNVGTQDAQEWIKELAVQPTPYGEKKIRIQTGQVSYVGNPTIVYDCDLPKYRVYEGTGGRTVVEYERSHERTAESRIVGGFILLEYPDGTRDYKVFDMQDVESWEKASNKKNKNKGANALYGWGWVGTGASAVYKKIEGGQIDKKFFEGKILKHAFKMFPRVIAEQDMQLPPNFVPDKAAAVRQGLDTSDLLDNTTEDVGYTEVKDELTEELNRQKEQENETETTVIIPDSDEPGEHDEGRPSANDDDEPNWN